MPFKRLSDNPLWGRNHVPLVMRWSDDQLEPLVCLLKPLLPDGLTDQMRLAIASVARSIVTAEAMTGGGVHYARAKDAYRRPRRYRDADPRLTWHYMTRAMDTLRCAGLIEHAVGEWFPHATQGLESVAWATDELLRLIGPRIDVAEPRGLLKNEETIVLRDGGDKRELDYVETVETARMRDQLGVINRKIAQLELRHEGQHVGVPTIRRIFNGSFERGGRLYCHGSSYQNMAAERRREITFIIDGAAHPAVEIDYSSLHIRMAYAEAGKRAPSGDPYTIDGFDRGLVKLAVNVLFNAATKRSAIYAIAEDLHDRHGGTERGCHIQARKVVRAIRRKHHRIKKYFGSDCGSRFQRQDSDMAIEVMTRMIQRTGRCPLPVHDSFLTPDIDADLMGQTMLEVAGDYGLHLGLKDSRTSGSDRPSLPLPPYRLRPPHPLCPPPIPSFPSLLFTMEVTTSELHRCNRRLWTGKALFGSHKGIKGTAGKAFNTPVSKRGGNCHDPPRSLSP
jgi:hypothetical protein